MCPTVFVQLSGEAKTYWGDSAGMYTLRDGGTTNSREDWISADGKKAIWYEGRVWNVGNVLNRGTKRCYMYTITTSPLSPVDRRNKWSYWNTKTWVQSDDVQVICAKTST